MDLIDFKNLFKNWSRTKEEDKTLFDTEIRKLKYVNGSVYWEE